MKGLVSHALVFAFASGIALAVWSREEKTDSGSVAERVEVWGGNADAVERVRFESPERTVNLDAKKDGAGRYYVGVVDRTESRPAPSSSPHAPAPPAPTEKRVTTRFIGAKAADEFVQKLAPLTAVRKLGAVAANRAEEFGFDKPEGTLKVKLRGAEQALVIGGATPGGQERYARHAGSGVVYAVDGDLVQSLLAAETRLFERELHAFADSEATRIRISKGGRTRELVALPDKKGAWADVQTPGKLDETAGNWMTKVGRLRASEYVEKPDAALTPESQVVRIDYFDRDKSLGFVELYKLPGDKNAEYLARSAHSRWFVKVLASTGEQVEQDLSSVLK